MASPSKSLTSIISHQAVTHPATVKSSVLNVATVFQATLWLFAAFVEAAANTNPAKWYIQGSAQTSGDEDWVRLATIEISETGTPATEALTATEPSAETVLAVASTTGFAARDEIYVQDAGTLIDSEWAELQKIATNVSVTLIDGLTNGKDSSDFIWGSAQRDAPTFNVESYKRIRVVFSHEGAAGANMHIKVDAVEEDSIA